MLLIARNRLSFGQEKFRASFAVRFFMVDESFWWRQSCSVWNQPKQQDKGNSRVCGNSETFLTACFIKWGTETRGFALFGSWFVDTQHFQHLPSQRNFFFFFRAKRNFESLSCCDAVMESGGVSRMTLLLMKLFFRGHLFSRETMNLSKWSFVILTVMFSVWIPTSADSLTGKV